MKLWLFRAAAILLVPAALLSMVEVSLRIVGFGYPTSFLLQTEANGRQLWVQNDRFGWRFLGPRYSRAPEPLAFDRKKSPGADRIFVMGESAALGDPNPDFGLPRMLGALLSLRYPGTTFEVVNVAMTAINSHAIREIASDCANAQGDIWVVYMGNNEVVGPFGSGTVFGSKAPPMAAIRAGLALKATRTGQLLDTIYASLTPPETGKEEWGGMMMFLDQQVAANDPGMKLVYHHFRRNLEDIIDSGRNAGAALIVCNVAVNLKDCAPFASQFQPGSSEQATSEWKNHYLRGVDLQRQGQWVAALAVFEEALEIDARVAELHFRMGQCALELGDREKASHEFSRARDLDTLRFRFDTRMSEIVREVVSQREDPQVRFVDAKTRFAAESSDGIPGQNFFYEHVHLTWEGNWLLAMIIAEQLEPLLSDDVRNAADALATWPSADACARRLAWTERERLEGLSEVRGRLQDPPFTLQLNHEEQIAYLDDSIERLGYALGPEGAMASCAACESAAKVAPEDAVFQRRLAALRLQTGDADGAIEAARRVTELLPHAPSAWNQLATTLAQSGHLDEALEVFEQALSLDPDDIGTRHNMALSCVRAGKTDEALKQWNRVVELKPRFGSAYLGMGQIFESQGKTEAANELYRKALQNQVYRSTDLAGLGRLCLKKGWYDAALTNLQDAAILAPTDASIRTDLAMVLKAMGQAQEASEQLALARRYDGTLWVAKFQSGLEQGRQSRPQEAAESFREVVRLNPDLMEGHLNLAIALSNLGLTNEAVFEFNEVLRLSPTNAQALRYLEGLSVNEEQSAGE